MTVIAWDGRYLAGDKMTNFGGLHATVTKVHRINGRLVGGCGTQALIREMIDWISGGCDPTRFPAAQRDEDKACSMLVVNAGGVVWQYETTPYPLVLENKFWAVGSGRDFAMMAMRLGKTAREAVVLTSQMCNDCGNGVDVVELPEWLPIR